MNDDIFRSDEERAIAEKIAKQQEMVNSTKNPEKPISIPKKAELQSEIADLEATLNLSSKKFEPPKISGKEFFTADGEETWYVKNVSDKHVALGIPNTETIKRGTCVDLLQIASLEEIKTFKGVRAALDKRNNLLQRITPEEYYLYLAEVDRRQKSREQFEKDYIPTGNTTENSFKSIRPVIVSKIEKIKNFFKTGVGYNPVDFIEWIGNEPLTEDEVDYIQSLVTEDKSIRIALLKKKQEILEK